MTELLLRQGDPTWAKIHVGHSSKTMSAVGCLVTCYAQALRDLGVDPDATPLTVNDRGVFVGAGLVQVATAKRLGLDVDVVATTGTMPRLMQHVSYGLEAGGRVILHVDHDSAKVSGDAAGDHFVLARRLTKEGYIFADPATGREHLLDGSTLTANVGLKSYLLRSARIVRPAK
jgi:hypothetical protein